MDENITYVTVNNDSDFNEFWIPKKNLPEVLAFLRSKSISDATEEATDEELLALMEPTGEWIG